MELLDDADLFSKIQEGNSEAFEQMYDRYSGLVYTFALHGCSNEELASEVTQDVFVRLWTTSAQYRPEQSQFRTWLLTITRRILYDKLRQQRRNGAVILEWYGQTADDLGTGLERSVESVSFHHWFREDVSEAMQALNFEERTVIELAYFHQLTLSEIAQQMNRPLGTVKTRLHKALKFLREMMPEWREGAER
ncbi:RNA polymerase sigma factor [Alicyclobacillus ferrooxydans]|uniref:RNA polymerase subunit sigma-24 n=1 Tax=Alicyclobacillus ferrooxydans TaxID=471514 RepID=A0A0P9CYS5_9BACL|nr:sigma-70 family RNA polymerase sigma factor [Alicyclobacillus ferrooxydans]KPV42114.1 hypothetical protein AN477_18845 [Alicyclobacillus ferrooxydans]